MPVHRGIGAASVALLVIAAMTLLIAVRGLGADRDKSAVYGFVLGAALIYVARSLAAVGRS